MESDDEFRRNRQLIFVFLERKKNITFDDNSIKIIDSIFHQESSFYCHLSSGTSFNYYLSFTNLSSFPLIIATHYNKSSKLAHNQLIKQKLLMKRILSLQLKFNSKFFQFICCYLLKVHFLFYFLILYKSHKSTYKNDITKNLLIDRKNEFEFQYKFNGK